MDLHYGPIIIAVEYKPPHGYGVSKVDEDSTFEVGHDNVFPEWEGARVHLETLLRESKSEVQFYSLIVEEAKVSDMVDQIKSNAANKVSREYHCGDFLIWISEIPEEGFGCYQLEANTRFQVIRHYSDAAYIPFLERLIAYLRKCGVENDMWIEKGPE